MTQKIAHYSILSEKRVIEEHVWYESIYVELLKCICVCIHRDIHKGMFEYMFKCVHVYVYICVYIKYTQTKMLTVAIFWWQETE